VPPTANQVLRRCDRPPKYSCPVGTGRSVYLHSLKHLIAEQYMAEHQITGPGMFLVLVAKAPARML
jgi:hypothetical protein